MSPYAEFLNDLQYWFREYGAETVLDDIAAVNPELFNDIKKSLTNTDKYDTIPALLKRKLGR